MFVVVLQMRRTLLPSPAGTRDAGPPPLAWASQTQLDGMCWQQPQKGKDWRGNEQERFR